MATLPNHTAIKLATIVSALLWTAAVVRADGDKSTSAAESRPATSALTAPTLIAPTNSIAAEPLPAPSRPNGIDSRKSSSPSPKPFLRPAEPRRVPAVRALSIKEETIPAPEPIMMVEQPAVDVRPAPPIDYDTDRRARRMFAKSGEINVTMIARNPADGCFYEIPMCIPGCCVGEPRVEGDRGLLGRGVVEFCWDCGFTATVKFRKILGNVKVEYEGR